MDCSLPGSSIHGILQARILEWVGIPFSRGSSQPKNWTQNSSISCIAGRFFTHWAIWEVKSIGNDPLKRIILVNIPKPQPPSVQFSSVTQSGPTLCDPMNRSTPGLPVHHQLPEFTQNHVHRVCDAIQPSRPRSSPSPPAPNPSQHQSLFQWVNSLHEVAKVLEFQL